MLIPLSLILSLGQYIPVAANLVDLPVVRLFYQAARSVKKYLLLLMAGRHNRSTAAGKHVSGVFVCFHLGWQCFLCLVARMVRLGQTYLQAGRDSSRTCFLSGRMGAEGWDLSQSP